MKRITVTDIRSLHYLDKNSQQILASTQAALIKIIQDQIILFTNGGDMKVYNLNNGNLQYCHKLNFPKVKHIVKYGKLFGIISDSSNDLIILNMQSNQTVYLSAHLSIINDLCAQNSCFITASKDMTIRVWQIIEENHLINNFECKPVKFPQALKGHKGSVTCVAVYDKFLISGSSDKSIICWTNREVWASAQIGEGIIKILPCFSSSKIIIVTENRVAHFVQLNSIIKKKIQIRGTLNLGNLMMPLFMTQIDDSFAIFASKNQFQFIQVNLMKTIHQLQICEHQKWKLSDLKCKGRCIIYGQTQNGVSIVKL